MLDQAGCLSRVSVTHTIPVPSSASRIGNGCWGFVGEMGDQSRRGQQDQDGGGEDGRGRGGSRLSSVKLTGISQAGVHETQGTRQGTPPPSAQLTRKVVTITWLGRSRKEPPRGGWGLPLREGARSLDLHHGFYMHSSVFEQAALTGRLTLSDGLIA